MVALPWPFPGALSLSVSLSVSVSTSARRVLGSPLVYLWGPSQGSHVGRSSISRRGRAWAAAKRFAGLASHGGPSVRTRPCQSPPPRCWSRGKKDRLQTRGNRADKGARIPRRMRVVVRSCRECPSQFGVVVALAALLRPVVFCMPLPTAPSLVTRRASREDPPFRSPTSFQACIEWMLCMASV